MPPDELPAPGAALPAASAGPAPAPGPAAAEAAPAPAAAPLDASPGTGTEAPPAADAAPPEPSSKGKDAPAAPAKDFAPSLLDEAAKTPTAEPPKPAEADPAKDPAKPAEGDKPPAAKEPAADAAKPDAAKPADQAKPAEPPAPIEYAFTVPDAKGERVPLPADAVDPERFGAFTAILNEVRAPPEQAQKLVDMHMAEVNRAVDKAAERQWDVFNEQQIKSREEVMADPVLGGSRHDTAIRTVMSTIDAFSLRDQNTKAPRSADAIAAERKQLMDDFRATGIANRASLLRMLHWVGDTYVREGAPRPAPPPRGANPATANRGTGRYRNTTPASA